MAITLLSKLIFNWIPIINGYGIEMYLIFYVYGLILIKDIKYQITFGIITPWFLLVVPPIIANGVDLLFEYILPLYIFLPFIAFSKFVDYSNQWKKNKKVIISVQILIFSFCFILGILIKLLVHTLAGYWWWTPGQLSGSFIFNMPIYLITLAIDLPIGIIVYIPLMKLRESNLS